MNRKKLNLTVDLLAAVFFTLCAGTGFLLWLVFPRGTAAAGSFLSASCQQWHALHVGVSFFLMLLLALHLVLHRSWIAGVGRKIVTGTKISSCRLRANAYLNGVGGILGVLVLVTGMVLKLVYPIGTPRRGQILFLDLNYGWWCDAHFFTGILFTACVILHLALHGRWIRAAVGVSEEKK